MPNLYLIYAGEYLGHETYSSAVVCANSEQEARCVHPNGRYVFANGSFVSKQTRRSFPSGHFSGWVHPDKVKVTFVGVAARDILPGSIVCASFNAG